MSDQATAGSQPKPSSSVKLVLLGEAAVGKVRAPEQRLFALSHPASTTNHGNSLHS